MPTTSVFICDADEMARRALGRAVTEHGLALSGEALTAVQALHMLRRDETDVVVIANDLQGLPGIDVTPELVASGYRVILISADPLVLRQAREAGAFAAVAKGDLASFEHALSGLAHETSDGERRSTTDRRSGPDRRETQDWSKVIRERRVGDRRQGDRRAPASISPTVGATQG